MTKDQAAQIISRAIVAEGNQQHILGADAFAARLATALDATGLLTYADNNRTGISPPATSSTGEHAANTQQDQPAAWASRRDRSINPISQPPE